MTDHRSCPLWVYRLLPFLRWWPMVTRTTLKNDMAAGMTGAVIVLPQAVAFATIAGLPPEYGVYSAIVPTIVAALWGSSRHLVSGPTTAISIALFASVAPLAVPGGPHYLELVLTLTLLTGVFQLALGLARMGALVNFISHTVVIGFTAGAALLIAASQIKHFFGVDIPRGTPFFEIFRVFASQIDQVNPYVAGVGIVTLATGLICRRLLPRLPFMIIALIAGSLFAAVLNLYIGEDTTRITSVGALSTGLPPFGPPGVTFDSLRSLLFPALIITVLALTEAASISRAIASRSGQPIDGNQEFIGQGLSNIVGSFFSSYASSGSFNRSAVNHASGASTPLAAVLASVILVALMFLVAPYFVYLPDAAIAGLLFLVARGLIDTHHIKLMPKVSRQEALVLWVTLVGTLVDLEKGIFFGVALSLILYLYRTSHPQLETVLPDTDASSYHYVAPDGRPECPQIKLVRLNGSVYFGAVDHIQKQFRYLATHDTAQRHLVIMASGVNFVDLAGAYALAELAQEREKVGGELHLYRLKPAVAEMLRTTGIIDQIGSERIWPAKSRPPKHIYSRLDVETCRLCKARIFPHCHERLPNGEAREGSERTDERV